MRKYSLLIAMLLTLSLALPAAVQADVVGRVTQVEGHVDLLKGGKLPATPAKVDESVKTGDVIRTKSLSRAQLTFMDNTVITIAPGSRLAIEEYLFEPAKGMRNAVLQLFQGLAHVVVTKIFQVEQPDFIIKTHTAVLGVRGTELGVRLSPNASTILNFKGITRVANIFPEVGDLRFKRAHKVAFSFGPASVDCHDMQGTTVFAGLPPTVVFKVTLDDQKVFMGQMVTGLTSRKSGTDSGTGTAAQASSGGGSSSGSSSTGGTGTEAPGTGGGGGGVDATSFSTLASDTPLLSSTSTSTTAATNTVINSITTPTGTGVGSTGTSLVTNIPVIPPSGSTSSSSPSPPPPPPVVPPVEPPQTSVTYNFVAVSYSTWLSNYGGTTSTVTSSGWSQRTGSWPAGTYPEYYTTSSSGSRTVVQGANYPTPGGTSTSTSYSVMTGSVTGLQGGTLTGTATTTGGNSYGDVQSWGGTVTLEPSGRLYYVYACTLTDSTRQVLATGTSTAVPGTYFTQTLDGAVSSTSSAPFTTQTSSTLWGVGSRTGVLPGYFAVNLTGTSSFPLPIADMYLPQEYGNITSTLAGVVSPGPGGTLVGSMTVLPTDRSTPPVSGLSIAPSPYLFPRAEDLNTPIVSSITIQPDGSASGSAYETRYQDGKFGSSIYTITQNVPQPSPVAAPAPGSIGFAQTYNGFMYLNNASWTGPNTLLAQGQGWGQRTGVYDGYFGAYTEATWAPVSGSLPSPYGSAVAVTRMDGSVSGLLGKTLSGNMNFYGSLLGGTSFSYSGPVTIENDGYLQFTIDPAKSSWTSLSGNGTASGKMNQWPGYYYYISKAANYNLNSTGYNPATGGYSNAILTLSPVGLSTVSGNIGLYSTDSRLPTSSSGGPVGLVQEGVYGTSELGAVFGVATYTLYVPFTPYNISFPGSVSLTWNNGSFFNTGGLFINPTLQVNSANIITPSILYAFSQSYNGFRLSTSSSPFSLASIEGYAWGQRLGVVDMGAQALPASYSPNNGYFVAQNLATAAAAPGVLVNNWLSVTGSMSGRVSGAIGQTLSGQMTFTGTTSSGTTLSYQGQVALSADGKLVFMYGGSGITGGVNGQPFTQSGVIQQVPGTSFTETASGSLTQTATTTPISGGQISVAAIKDTTPLTGSRTMGSTTTPTTASLAAGLASTVNTFPAGPNPGTGTMSLTGVVAGADWQTKWGVATGSSAEIGATISGPVTIDTAGKLTGQFVDQVLNPSGPSDKMAINVVSVPTAPGQTTSSFVQTVGGNFSQTATNNGTQATAIAPALTGTAAGTLSGPVNSSLIITSQSGVPSTFGTNSGTISANVVGVVGGPAEGVQTGVGSAQVVKTITSDNPPTTLLPSYVGTTTLQPGTGGVPPVLTTTLNSVLNVAPIGASTIQTGVLATTPKP
jgi:hypothetical protein